MLFVAFVLFVPDRGCVHLDSERRCFWALRANEQLAFEQGPVGERTASHHDELTHRPERLETSTDPEDPVSPRREPTAWIE